MSMLSISDRQHKEHLEWSQKIAFYLDQLEIFKHEFELIKNNNSTVFRNMAMLKEYKTLIEKKRSRLEEFKERIMAHEHAIVSNISNESTILWDHSEMKNDIQTFEDKFSIFKKALRNYISKRI